MPAITGAAIASATAVTNATVVVLSIEASFEVVHSRCPWLCSQECSRSGHVAVVSIYAGRETADPPRLLRFA